MHYELKNTPPVSISLDGNIMRSDIVILGGKEHIHVSVKETAQVPGRLELYFSKEEFEDLIERHYPLFDAFKKEYQSKEMWENHKLQHPYEPEGNQSIGYTYESGKYRMIVKVGQSDFYVNGVYTHTVKGEFTEKEFLDHCTEVELETFTKPTLDIEL